MLVPTSQCLWMWMRQWLASSPAEAKPKGSDSTFISCGKISVEYWTDTFSSTLAKAHHWTCVPCARKHLLIKAECLIGHRSNQAIKIMGAPQLKFTNSFPVKMYLPFFFKKKKHCSTTMQKRFLCYHFTPAHFIEKDDKLKKRDKKRGGGGIGGEGEAAFSRQGTYLPFSKCFMPSISF